MPDDRPDDRPDPRDLDVEGGDAVVPDAADAPDRHDLAPGDGPASAPVEGDADAKSAVPPPVPAHGESASADQIREATLAEEEDEAQA